MLGFCLGFLFGAGGGGRGRGVDPKKILDPMDLVYRGRPLLYNSSLVTIQ